MCGYAALGAPEGAEGARSSPAPAQKRRGMPVVFSRIALLVLSGLVVALVLYLVLHG